MTSRRWLDRMLNVESRVVYGIMGLAALVPLLIPGFVLPVTVTAPVRRVYDAVEALAPGAPVFVVMDFDPSVDPEMTPMAVAFLEHCFRRRLRVTGMTLWPQGVTLGLENMRRAARHTYREALADAGGGDGAVLGREVEVAAREGEDWVYLGTQPGG
ncbi:MAG: hypothetical protein JXQ29_00565 [Planctomycetes bacterium]|nr:hypothetical protein [Planctomycetota bacterium]